MATLDPDKKQRIDAVLKTYAAKMAELRGRRNAIAEKLRNALKERKLQQIRDDIKKS